ncbi:MAG: transposase, partial [Verrucomicrobiales bacterium]|nr:transposase [Verrucomicrobiales bacterium]
FARLPKKQEREFEKLVADRWNKALDSGAGSCLFRDNKLSGIVADSLTFFHGSRGWTGDYVVMPNHVHVLLTPIAGNELEDILQSVKSFTSNKINQITGSEGSLWQRESYDHIVRDAGQLVAFQMYIRSNPAKSGLKEGEYRMSDERCYEILK